MFCLLTGRHLIWFFRCTSQVVQRSAESSPSLKYMSLFQIVSQFFIFWGWLCLQSMLGKHTEHKRSTSPVDCKYCYMAGKETKGIFDNDQVKRCKDDREKFKWEQERFGNFSNCYFSSAYLRSLLRCAWNLMSISCAKYFHAGATCSCFAWHSIVETKKKPSWQSCCETFFLSTPLIVTSTWSRCTNTKVWKNKTPNKPTIWKTL